MSFLSRTKNSWSLFKQSLAVMRDHPKLLFFPVVISLFTIGILLFFLAPIVLQPTGHAYTESAHWQAVADSIFTKGSVDESTDNYSDPHAGQRPGLTPRGLAYVAVIYFASMFLATFFASAFYHEILSALQGGDVSIRRGLKFALSKLSTILLWSLFAGAIGAAIKMLEERVGFIGKWILRIIGIAWSVASIFAIPIIVAEDEKNPIEILKRSAKTLKGTWGEALAGYVGIQLGGLLILFGSLLFLFLGGVIAFYLQSPWTMLGAFVLWLLFILSISYTLGVAGNIYRCALYLFAAKGQVPGYFDRESMDLAWKIKKT